MPFDARTQPHDVPGAARRRAVGRQEIITGDCLAELRAMPAGTVDVVVTSPPYNIGVAYRGHDDRMPRPAYLGWLGAIGAEIARVLKPDGSFFLNVGGTNADPWVVFDVAAAFRDAFTLQNHIAWVKSVSIGDDTVGHFKPITSRRYLNQNHEAVLHFTKTGRVEIDRLLSLAWKVAIPGAIGAVVLAGLTTLLFYR